MQTKQTIKFSNANENEHLSGFDISTNNIGNSTDNTHIEHLSTDTTDHPLFFNPDANDNEHLFCSNITTSKDIQSTFSNAPNTQNKHPLLTNTKTNNEHIFDTIHTSTQDVHLLSQNTNIETHTSINAPAHVEHSVLNNTAKFSFPRKQVPNNYPSNDKDVLQLIQEHCASSCPGTKEYNNNENYVNGILDNLNKSKKNKKLSKQIQRVNTTQESVHFNYVHSNKPLRYLSFLIDNNILTGMVDSGSSHSLISKTCFDKLNPNSYEKTPVSLNMICASGVMKNNITAHVKLTLQFITKSGKILKIKHDFLLCTKLAFNLIFGDDFLTNGILTPNLTPTAIFFKNQKTKSYDAVDLVSKSSNQHENIAFISQNICLEPETTVPIDVIFNHIPNQATSIFLDNINTNTEFTIQPCLQHYELKADGTARTQVYITNTSQDNIRISRLTPISIYRYISTDKETETDPHSFLTYVTRQIHDVTEPTIEHHHSDSYNTWNALNSIDQANLQRAKETFPSLHLPDNIEDHDMFETGQFLDIDKTESSQNLTYLNCDYSQCDHEQELIMKDMLKEYSEAFAKNKLDLGLTPLMTHRIDIDPNKKVISQKQRFMPQHKVDAAKEIIDQWVDAGILVRCINPLMKSNLVLIPKVEESECRDSTKASKFNNRGNDQRDQKFRICVDHRSLNDICLDRTAPNTMTIDHVISQLSNKRVTCLDISNAYFNIPLDDESVRYTAFYLQNETYSFKRCVMGLISSPNAWGQLMELMLLDSVFAQARDTLTTEQKQILDSFFKNYAQFTLLWVDDIFIHTPPDLFELHTICVQLVFYAIIRANIKCGTKKCIFYATKFQVLGLSLDSEHSQLYLNHAKATSILSWNKPSCAAELQSRLFSLQYYSRFHANMKAALCPLFLMLRQKTFYWDEQCENAWDQLKAIILSDIHLTIPSADSQLAIYSDASLVSCSQILFCIDKDQNFKIVSANSKIFNVNDSRKPMHLKECISLCLAMKTFMNYLEASTKPVLIFVDARNLLKINISKQRKILSNSLTNFFSQMALHIDFNIYHVPGFINVLSDIYSRAFTNSRFIQNGHYTLSKAASEKVPKLKFPFSVTSETLKAYFDSALIPDPNDTGDLAFSKPRTLKSMYTLYKNRTAEQCFTDSILMLKQFTEKVTERQNELRHTDNPSNWNTEIRTLDKHSTEKGTPPPNTGDSTLPPTRTKQGKLLSPLPQKDFTVPDLPVSPGKSLIITDHDLDLTELFQLLQDKQDYSTKDFESAKVKLLRKYIEQIILYTFGEDLDKLNSTKLRNSLLENAQKMLKLENLRKEGKIPQPLKKHIVELFTADIEKNINKRYTDCTFFNHQTKTEKQSIDQTLSDLDNIFTTTETEISIAWNLINEETKANIDYLATQGTEPVQNPTVETDKDKSTCYKDYTKTIIQFQTSGKHAPCVQDCSNGIDLKLQSSRILEPQEIAKFDTLTKINIPSQFVGVIYTRSSAALKGLLVHQGLIDGNFTGSIKLVIKNITDKPIYLEEGKSYAQLVLHHSLIPTLKNEHFNFDSTRGTKEFGSSLYNIELELSDNPLDIFNIQTNVTRICDLPCYHNNDLTDTDTDEHLSFNHVTSTIDKDRQTKDSALEFIKNHFSTDNLTKQEQCVTEYLDLQCNKLGIIASDFLISSELSKQNFIHLQSFDEFFSLPIELLLDNKQAKGFVLMNDLLYKTILSKEGAKHFLCIPTLILPNLVYTLHSKLNHSSCNQTSKHFRRYFYHPFAQTCITKLCRSCITCRVSTCIKPLTYKNLEGKRTQQAEFPRQIVALDLIPSLPASNDYSNILLACDEFSSYVALYPLKSKSADCIYKALNNLFTTFGFIPFIRTDLEPSLISALKRIQSQIPFTLISNAPYSHCQNGIAEKGVKLFKESVTKMIHSLDKPQEKNSWYYNLPLISQSINNTLHKSNISRYELFFAQTNNPVFQNNPDLFSPEPLDTSKPYYKKLAKILKHSNKFTHPFKVGDILTMRRENVALGQTKTFNTHFQPSLFKVTQITKSSPDVSILDLKSGKVHVARCDRLQAIGHTELSSLLPTLQFDPKILDYTKKSSVSDTPILENTLFQLPFYPDTDTETADISIPTHDHMTPASTELLPAPVPPKPPDPIISGSREKLSRKAKKVSFQ